MSKTAHLQREWIKLNGRLTDCQLCPRLREHCTEIATAKRAAFRDWTYWGKPVPNFGDPQAKLMIVGLAPAAHGANRTGRMFTGDRSGEWLYRALHKAGFANQPTSHAADDGLRLTNCAITAIAHCAPPDNRPLPNEIANCQRWFEETMDLVSVKVVIALGGIAWKGVIDEARRRDWWSASMPKFSHLAKVRLADRWLLGSYHPSQQNTFTGRLTEPMFDRVFAEARRLLKNDDGKLTAKR